MTPKEKAKELVDKMVATYDITSDFCYDSTAEQCALIAVKFARENPLNTEGYNKYLDEVKQEIEKL
jgi:hypothetical protein